MLSEKCELALVESWGLSGISSGCLLHLHARLLPPHFNDGREQANWNGIKASGYDNTEIRLKVCTKHLYYLKMAATVMKLVLNQ